MAKCGGQKKGIPRKEGSEHQQGKNKKRAKGKGYVQMGRSNILTRKQEKAGLEDQKMHVRKGNSRVLQKYVRMTPPDLECF